MDLPTRTRYNLARYSLTEKDFATMYKTQKGKCAICSRKMVQRNCHIDHDHLTWKTRGLLCGLCNTGLGMFRDEIAILARAIVYLESYGKSYP